MTVSCIQFKFIPLVIDLSEEWRKVAGILGEHFPANGLGMLKNDYISTLSVRNVYAKDPYFL